MEIGVPIREYEIEEKPFAPGVVPHEIEPEKISEPQREEKREHEREEEKVPAGV